MRSERNHRPGAVLRIFIICLLFGQFALGLASAPVFARQDIVPGSRYTSVRGAAMGDAYLPLGEDVGDGLFYNPADLAKVKGAHAEAVNVSFYGNGSVFSNLGTNFYRATSLSSYESTLAKNPGTSFGVGGAILPGFVSKWLTFGVLAQSQLLAAEDSAGNIRNRSLYQIIPAVGTGVKLAGGIVRIGYSLQWVNQASGDVLIPAGASPVGYNQGLAQGAAFSHTLGFALTMPWQYLPSLNLVARNVGTASYSSSTIIPLAANSTSSPATEQASYDASFSISPRLGGNSFMNLVFEDRDLTNVSGVSLLGRAAVGVEIALHDSIFLRGGWGSGYPAFGLGVRNKNREFSFARYSEEIGAGYHQSEDTRYILQYMIRAF